MHRVEAQQARRILDRLVGYKISPILWEKVKRGISAGRVQSVALRMVVDREYSILSFNPIEYWTFAARVEGEQPPPFSCKMTKWESKTIRTGAREAKHNISTGDEAQAIEAVLKDAQFQVNDVRRKARKQNPPPPFTTSKLQQEASRSLGLSVHRTMRIAQALYEGKDINGEREGLITYMRTDSTRVSDEALTSVRDHITSQYEAGYLPEQPRKFTQKKKNIQDSHEAIRPTNVAFTPDAIAGFLDPDEKRLYTLIWRRFVASQMAAKNMDETVIEIAAGPAEFEAKGLITTFPGFTVLYKDPNSKDKDRNGAGVELPDVKAQEKLNVLSLEKAQNFTKPPARFSEASLVKALEENGIGRPSTYATIIATIQNRTYVEKREGRFIPTDLGFLVTTLLTEAFPDLMDIHYTARLENQLDQVEDGTRTWQNMLEAFYEPFGNHLKQAEDQMANMKRKGLPTDLPCEQCSGTTVIKNGKYGLFLSCGNYPDCTFAKPISDIALKDTKMLLLQGLIGRREQEKPEILDQDCPKCSNPLVRKRGKYGSFIACSNYPDCRYIHQETVGVECPKEGCSGQVLIKKSKRGKVFYGCSNCSYVSWFKPTGEPCPECKAKTLYLKERKHKSIIFCQHEGCDFTKDVETS